ncbi:hypothetical protein FBY35_3699 [Streptomyces sp. SLBN-118]|uniref:hypothetical protein n=1 Tax=Streptomyces sp. SLBN-118 TaxID=2768454 RepID=UPI00115457CA|nr:hypothetical protein [Streptomyces sp. SLBN-118]TQK42320.1 hypothetical protein FBY35_3699 [Streptomyces sp. SLBN-118]
MWKLPDAVAQRFPLIARPRPACLPLPQRVHALVELADTAANLGDPSMASTVYNQAALIASDVGAPETARAMCHQHAAAYLHAAPLPGRVAIRALEPVVNLARLQIRAGQHDVGRQRLLALFDAVSTGAPAQVEDIAVPAYLVANADDRQEVRVWLWSVLLADGTRALATAGRWAEALAHVEAHRGVGQRMLDGRQVAVLAALASGNTLDANSLLAHTVSGEAWEGAVTDCLTVLCRRISGPTWRRSLQNLVTTYLERPDRDDMTVFNTRLGLAVLDVIASPEDPAARLVVVELHRRTNKATDGYAARETLAHPLFTALATDREAQDCRALLHACALGTGSLPNELRGQLVKALRKSAHVIRQSVAHLERACPIGQK